MSSIGPEGPAEDVKRVWVWSALVSVLSLTLWLALGPGYEISKAAAWSATNALRVRLREQGTIVSAVHVAVMDTDMTAKLSIPKEHPRDVAAPAGREGDW
jgi:NAD(P)-dependent dehydrogenase (short-subunit alcohol dehydrogenase family)